MTFANKNQILLIVILVVLINFAINVSSGESQTTNSNIEISIPPAFKDKSLNYDLLLLNEVIARQKDTNGIPYLSSRRPLEWLEFILKDKWINSQIWTNYVSCTSPIEREKAKKLFIPTPSIQHHGEPAIIYKYSIDSYDFAIVDVGERLSFLIRIPSNTAGKIDIKSTLEYVNNIFNVNPEFINILQSNLVENSGTYYVMIEDQKSEHYIQINASIYSRVVHGLFSPKYVLLSFDGLKRRSKGQSGIRTIWKDSSEKTRYQQKKENSRKISQQSTNELPGISR